MMERAAEVEKRLRREEEKRPAERRVHHERGGAYGDLPVAP